MPASASLPTNAGRAARWTVYAEGLLARLGFGIITFALPFYALSLGMSYAEVGALAATRLVAAIACKPLMAHLADRIGKRPVYLASIAGRCLVAILFAVTTQPWALFAVRALHGLTTAARDPVSAVIIVDSSSHGMLARAFAWYGSAREAGAALGFLIAGALLSATDDFYPAAFLCAAAIAVASLIMVLLTLPRDTQPVASAGEATPTAPASSEAREDWKELALLGLLIALTANMVGQLFPLLAVEHADLSKAETGVLYAVATAAAIITGPLWGWIADTVSQRLALAARGILNGGSTLLYAFWPAFAGFLLGRIMDESGKAAFRAAWGRALAGAAAQGAPKRKTQRVAHLDNAQSVGEAMGPALGGWLWDNLGVYGLLAVRFMLGIATELYAQWLARKKSRRGS